MLKEEIARIRELVASTGATIQPLLHPHGAIAKRNAYAHIWLGIRTRFGAAWRESAIAHEVETFINWTSENPNADDEEFTGSTTRLPVQTPSLDAPRTRAEPGLFD
ncbi:MAG: hypothetical protein EXS15_04715 [Phycisphaerales bacterium]|nr:hypothetical protein [Phycisphaerales bacterium]